MANMGDDVLRNILARLPGKSLLRFRCASKHWNDLISYPYFMKSGSRRMILFPFPRPPVVIDDNVPVEDEVHSMARIRSPLEHQEEGIFSIVGTFNGIVLLALTDESLSCQLILYNPLTYASKILLVMDMSSIYHHPMYLSSMFHHPHCVFGFGHGTSTKDDLKLVIIKVNEYPDRLRFKCDVFDLKSSSWSTKPQYLQRNFQFWGDVGMFLNGFLYWPTFSGISSLNIKEMVFSKINLPWHLREHEYRGLLLGSIGGCLCMIDKIGTTRLDMMLMKEDYTWMKAHSFTFGLEGIFFEEFTPICILENGKFLMINGSIELVIYDPSKDSYKTLNGLAIFDDLKIHINTISDFKKIFKILNSRIYAPLSMWKVWFHLLIYVSSS